MDFDDNRVTYEYERSISDISRYTLLDPGDLRNKFALFLRNFHINVNVFLYRDELLKRYRRGDFYIEVNIRHLDEFDTSLNESLHIKPAESLGSFESAIKDVLQQQLANRTGDNAIPDFQLILLDEGKTQELRKITADKLNRLVRVSGIATSVSRVKARAVSVTARCTVCGTVKKIESPTSSSSPMSSIPLPAICDRASPIDGLIPADSNDCGPNPYVVIASQCRFEDQQTLKLQETPEIVPTGEMPRSIAMTCNQYLVDRVSPGMRIMVTGIYSVFLPYSMNRKFAKGNSPSSSTVRTPFLRVLGIRIESDGSGRVSSSFTPSEEEYFRQLSKNPRIYDQIASSIAPSISGDYTVDIKKAISCLLMGGSMKMLPDRTRLRGDINVLLLGDPSTAKSQLLKYVEKVAPIGVYTSGKGSSAAGLTASIIKDAKGEFYLEAGSMVMADGGVICIDEFDKMNEIDRTAIHEAMEQQTISIAKAGITTVLNARTSVLAAANPIFGRYDELRSTGDNTDMMATILSRFDLIFIVRDIRDPKRDKSIADHVLDVHMRLSKSDGSTTIARLMSDHDALTPGSNISLRTSILKRYVCYCRQKCSPRLSPEAAQLLCDEYVSIRDGVRKKNEAMVVDAAAASSGNKVSWHQARDRHQNQGVPITVRQLEALVRVSEALARMRLSSQATVDDVRESLRLFRVSTMYAANSQPVLSSILGMRGNNELVLNAENFIRHRIGQGISVNAKRIIDEAQVQGHSEDSVKRAIAAMVLRAELQEQRQKKTIKRIR